MSGDTLLAHLVGCLGRSSENVATEALAHILNNPTAARAFKGFVEQVRGGPLPDLVEFHTQQRNELDGGVRDLVAHDRGGNERVVVEAKFWAGLTVNQPVTYLRPLITAGEPAILLFVVPRVRIPWIASKVKGLCESDRFTLGCLSNDPPAWRIADSIITVAVTSWDRVLRCLEETLRSGRREQLTADLAQLRGLVDEEERLSFTPFNTEFLEGPAGVHLINLEQLIPHLIAELAAGDRPLATKASMEKQRGFRWWGLKFRLTGWDVILNINIERWGTGAATPLWLQVLKTRGHDPATALAPLGQNRLFRDAPSGVQVPIDLPVGAERDEVLEHAAAQVREVAGLLSKHPPVEPTGDQSS